MLKKHFWLLSQKRLAAASRPALFGASHLVSGAACSADVLKPSHLICSGEEWSSTSSRNQWSSKVAVNGNDCVFQQLSKKTCTVFLLLSADEFSLSVSV